MDIAVIRVTLKQCKVINSWKKRKYIFWSIFSRRRRRRRRSDFTDWDTAKWETNEQQNCKFHIIGQ